MSFLADNPMQFNEKEQDEICSFTQQIEQLERLMDTLSEDIGEFLKTQDINTPAVNSPRSPRVKLTDRTAKRSVAALTNSKNE